MSTKTQIAQRNLGFTLSANTFSKTGYTFSSWNTKSDGSGTSYSDEQENVSFSNNITLYAQWAINQYKLALVASPTNGGTVTGGGTFNYGTSRTVMATPKTDYSFVSWSDGGDQSHSVTVDSNKTLVATFALQSEAVNFYAFESSPTPYSTTYVPDTGATVADRAPDPSVFSMTGWTFQGWRQKDKDGSSDSAIIIDDPATTLIQKGTDYYAYWTREYKNLLFQTGVSAGSGYASGNVDQLVKDKSRVYTYDLNNVSDVKIPVNATVSIAKCIGLLQHDGNVTSHYLLFAPGVATSQSISATPVQETTHTSAEVDETYTEVWYGTREWNASKKKWIYTNVQDESGIKLDIDTGRKPTSSISAILRYNPNGKSSTPWQNNSWGKYSPLQYYNEYHYFDESMLNDESTGQPIPHANWTIVNGKHLGTWNADLSSHLHMFSGLATNRSCENTGLIQVDVDDFCQDDRETFPIPDAMPDGLQPSKLVMILSKQTLGCTVKWRLYIHQLILDLR